MIEKPDTETMHELRWYLAQYKPNAAQIAVRNLENQSFGTFLPLQAITKRKGKIFQRQILPLFPGYLFIQIDPDQGPWRQVNSTRGVARLVRFGTDKSAVPNGIVEALIARCDKQSILRQTSETKSSQLHAGNQTQVTQGPFSGFIATISDIEPNDRINILIEIMGQTIKVAINAGALQPIG
ncbi:MAG: transcriptional activator RfaH [Alphaproteobacteria bacterium]|nr:transcriptional activator RfaH [Alphaproteobacteria bacterium]